MTAGVRLWPANPGAFMPVRYQITEHSVIILDDEDVPTVSNHVWIECATGFICRAEGNIQLTRFLANPPPNLYVFFRNGKRFDYRKSNLAPARSITYLPEYVCTAKAKAYFRTKNGTYQVVVHADGRCQNLGTYATAIEAKKVAKEFRESFRARAQFPPAVNTAKLPLYEGKKRQLDKAKLKNAEVRLAVQVGRALEENVIAQFGSSYVFQPNP